MKRNVTTINSQKNYYMKNVKNDVGNWAAFGPDFLTSWTLNSEIEDTT